MAECDSSSESSDQKPSASDSVVQDKSDNKDIITKELPIVVRMYFSTVKADNSNFIKAFCDLCKPAKKIIRGQYRAPSNFAKHKVNHSFQCLHKCL